MEQVIRTDQERCDLLPEATLKDREADYPVSEVRALGEPIRSLWHQDLVSVFVIHAADRFDQSPTVPRQAHIEIFEMPSCNDNFHECSRLTASPWSEGRLEATIRVSAGFN